jgi:hypothetical protein
MSVTNKVGGPLSKTTQPLSIPPAPKKGRGSKVKAVSGRRLFSSNTSSVKKVSFNLPKGALAKIKPSKQVQIVEELVEKALQTSKLEKLPPGLLTQNSIGPSISEEVNEGLTSMFEKTSL